MNIGTLVALHTALKHLVTIVIYGAIGLASMTLPHVSPVVFSVLEAAAPFDILAQPALWGAFGGLVKWRKYRERPIDGVVSVILGSGMAQGFRGAHFKFLLDIFEFTDPEAIATVNAFVIGVLGIALASVLIDTFKAAGSVKDAPQALMNGLKNFFKRK